MSDVLQAESENLETINKQIEHKTYICPAHLDLKVQGDDLWKQKPGVWTCISFLPCALCFCTGDKRQLQPTHRDTETSGASLPLCSWEWESITPGFFCGSWPIEIFVFPLLSPTASASLQTTQTKCPAATFCCARNPRSRTVPLIRESHSPRVLSEQEICSLGSS